MFKPVKNLAANEYVSKIDGVFALLMVSLHVVYCFAVLQLFEVDSYYHIKHIFASFILYALLYVIIKLRKQPISSLGISLDIKWLSPLFVSVLVVGVYGLYTKDYSLLLRWLFYLIAIAGVEELAFRGFAFPRILKLTGNFYLSLVIAGALFGSMHHISRIVWYGAPWYGVFSEIGGGIVWNAFFLIVYAYFGNIFASILLHAALDFMSYFPLIFILLALYCAVLLAMKFRQRIQERLRKIP
jgi:membrane protease YdiL (CAAX protease family)